MSQLFFLRKL